MDEEYSVKSYDFNHEEFLENDNFAQPKPSVSKGNAFHVLR